MDFESISMQITEKCKCMASSSRVHKADCQEVIMGHTTNISTGLCWSINSTVIMSNMLNVHIHYVREYLFDLVVDPALERQLRVHTFPDKWHFNF